MKSFRVMFLIPLVIFIGCVSSLSEIRSSHPVNILESNKSPENIANCFYYKAQAENDKTWTQHWNRIDMNYYNNNYYIVLSLTGGFLITQNVTIGEVIIKSNNNNGSTIEIRIGWGGNKKILHYLHNCLHENNPGAIVGVKQ